MCSSRSPGSRRVASNTVESLLQALAPAKQLFGEGLLQMRLTDVLAVEHRNTTACSKHEQKGPH